MGRQINFYMSENVQAEFIDFLKQNDFMYFDYYAKRIEEPASKEIFDVYLYKENYGEILTKHDGRCLDSLFSSVIEFSKTIIKTEKKEIFRGRLWMTELYYDKSGNKVKKEERFSKDYQKLVRWIKKHVPYQEFDYNGHVFKDYISNEIIELRQEGFVFTS